MSRAAASDAPHFLQIWSRLLPDVALLFEIFIKVGQALDLLLGQLPHQTRSFSHFVDTNLLCSPILPSILQILAQRTPVRVDQGGKAEGGRGERRGVRQRHVWEKCVARASTHFFFEK